MTRFNPGIQKQLLKIKAGHVDCMKYNYPTLQQAGTIYGDEAISLWIKIQLEDLNNYCGVKEKMTPEQLGEIASIFLYNYGEIKIAEFALFMIKFKSGKYGQFYGTVDPLIITTAMNEFMDDRMIAFRISERERELREAAQKREEWKKNAITYEQYQREIAEEKQQK